MQDGDDLISRSAIERHHARLRKARRRYAAAIVVVVGVLATVLAVAWSRGEIAHTTLKTVAHPPAPVRLQPTSSAPTRRWSSRDVTAIGLPYWGGTVITHDQHTVRGRIALTGATTWSYTRTDRSVCSAIQDEGTTIAVFRLHGNCDELTALDSQSGARRWTRTLDEDGKPFDGPASYAIGPSDVMFISPRVIYSIRLSDGVDNWTWDEHGCTINRAVLGMTGALISQTCRDRQCAKLRFCGNGRQLALRPVRNPDGLSKAAIAANPDYIAWNDIGTGLQPVSSGDSVSATSPGSRQLTVLNSSTGAVKAQLPLRRPATATNEVAASADADLIWLNGYTYALASGRPQFRWVAATDAIPTVSGNDSLPSLTTAELFVPASDGAATIDASTGKVSRHYPIDAVPSGGLVYPLGAGLLVAGPATTVYG